jgi:hypothetical protein
MKKAGYFVLLVLFVLPAVARAQEGTQETPPTAPQPQAPAPAPPIAAEIYTPQYELSAGYNRRKFYFPDEPTAPTLGMNGGYASADRNFKRWLGAYAEISAAYKNRGVWGNSSVYSLLVGPQLYPLKHHKLTPFGHVLFGGGYYRNSVPANGAFGSKVEDASAFAWGGGGGMDLYLKTHLGIRVFEYDYEEAHFYGGNIDHGSSRISFGIVYRFGER